MVDPSTCSPDTLRLWSFLPPFAQQSDETTGYQFLSWLEGAIAGGSLYNTSASGLQAVDDLCRDSEYNLGWSAVMDVARCPTYALPWLGQFVGVRFNGTTVGNDAAMRAAILEESNFNRGTPKTIANCISTLLSPTGYVRIIERCPDAYSFTVQVYGANHTLTYAQLAQLAATYALVASTYPTYADMGDTTSSEDAIVATITANTPAGLNVYVDFF